MRDDAMDRVVPLNRLDNWKVADGEPDIRGWEVQTAAGERLGKVDDLLVDKQARKVRYVDVDMRGVEDKHVTVPIGYARLERNDRRVLVDGLATEQVRALPAYEHGTFTRDYEMQVAQACNASVDTNRDFYEADQFRDRDEARLTLSEEELAVGKREMRAGEVEVEKHVEHERVSRDVPLRHEEVEVERRPITDPMTAGSRPRISEDEVRIPLTEEEAVVEKRVVPKEELVVRKREVVETEHVEADLRKERAEVHREGEHLDRDRDRRV